MADNFFTDTIALMRSSADGQRAMQCVREAVATDRWNSFDKFHQTTRTLARRFRQAGAKTEIYTIPTGGPIGSGRWIIHQAADIRSATCDVISPISRRLIDYKQCPWHVVQWSAATPRSGLTGQVIVLDTDEAINRARPADVRGKVVLTSLYTWPVMPKLAALGAIAVISDRLIRDLPDAVGWSKFGWGGIELAYAAARLVGLVLSHNQGLKFRKLLAQHPHLRLRLKVDIHHYSGSHDVISGIIEGRDEPQSEVWSIAHTAEPGAVDNASGLAVSIEAAAILRNLIRSGRLPQPKRSIRLLLGYECYGFFHYLEHAKRYQTPMAGLCIDGVGSDPRVCDGQLQWRDTVPQSAGFVNRLGERIIRAALKTGNPGYRLQRRPFVSTADTLIGDPKYGFPCPWFESHYRKDGRPYHAYHSSADVPELLIPEGLAVAATATAAYLYYLADAGNKELLQLARQETTHALRELADASAATSASTTATATPAGAKADQAPAGATLMPQRINYIRDALHENLKRLQRWFWGGNRAALLAALNECENKLASAASAKMQTTQPRRRRISKDEHRIPRRTALLTPTLENTPAEIAARIRDTKLKDWALYWADGSRNLAEIADCLACETGREITIEQVARFFEAHRDLGYVTLVHPDQMISRRQIETGLKNLGLTPGMTVMVHSSMSKIGHVIGGAEAVVDAILKIIGPRGTLLAPTFNHGWAGTYNQLTTPTANGAIAEAVWRRPQAVRSDHPTHAVAAIGPRADELCADHIKNGVWSHESPIGRLIHTGGYILSLGVTQLHSTAYHVAEVEANCPCIDQFARRHPVIDLNGNLQQVKSLTFRSGRCPVRPEEIDDILDRRNLQRHGKIGQADARLARAKDVWQAHYDRLIKVCPTCTMRPKG